MKECMDTGKPLISILMAVYNPDLEWFSQQLESLEAQDYPNLELRILDDCSPDVSFQEIQQSIKSNVRKIPYFLDRNSQNLGSNRVFEKLTLAAKGQYIAYCDQDDIWFPKKLSYLEKQLVKDRAVLICSDVFVIDGAGKKIASSITKLRKRHKFLEGYNLTDSLLFRNFVIGCTMLICAETAKAATPFVKDMVHDHWLAMYASTQGKISVSPYRLVNYRIHANNQTSVLAYVKSKEDYIEERILPYVRRLQEISKRIPDSEALKKVMQWAQARESYARGDSASAKVIWKNRNLDRKTSAFELVAWHTPSPLFRIAIRMIQRGWL
ncbi:glycosyltransferase [Caproicibacter fermentans]|uniref:Glycosyltransferase n=1 Tax=Caproicibacter fermentans TaxID=2576756 RepID=A0A7G8TFM7_9FIRM|nr:glycosyltransferase [Caproicibacter fermentans]QNK42418.1 glycosyltransferase [Caproicibacter fermentans]